MFRVEARTLKDYFSADPDRERDLRALDALIRKAAPSLARAFFPGTADGKPGMSMKMIGYGKFQYRTKASKEAIDWPIVGLALQKNYISLYVAALEDGMHVVDRFAGRLGKVTVGRGCIRFRSFDDLDQTALAMMVARIEASVKNGHVSLQYNRVAKA